MRQKISKPLFIIGAILCAPFSLIFAHGGGVHWDEQKIGVKLFIVPLFIITVALALPGALLITFANIISKAI